jgi:hypothetical protein
MSSSNSVTKFPESACGSLLLINKKLDGLMYWAGLFDGVDVALTNVSGAPMALFGGRRTAVQISSEESIAPTM